MGTLDEILDEKTVVTKEVKEEAPRNEEIGTKPNRHGMETGKFAKQEVKDGLQEGKERGNKRGKGRKGSQAGIDRT